MPDEYDMNFIREQSKKISEMAAEYKRMGIQPKSEKPDYTKLIEENMDTYRELYLDKSDQLLNAMTKAIELQQENERLRKMIVEFGEGKVGVMRTAEQGEDFDSGLAFVNQEAHSIGEVVPGRVGKTTDEVDCFLRFHFSNSASVQVLIDDLIIVRDSIASAAECVCENHTDNDGWRCNVCGLLSPHRKRE